MREKLQDNQDFQSPKEKRFPRITQEQVDLLAQVKDRGLKAQKKLSIEKLEPEERSRLEDLREKGEKAIKKIVEANFGLVVTIAAKPQYQGRGLTLDDLFQEGSIGLLKATEKYDWKMGVPFSAFAGKSIEWNIKKALDEQFG